MDTKTNILMGDYNRTTNEIFRWAVMGRDRLNFIVDKHVDELKNINRVEKLTDNILVTGNSIINQTIRKLNEFSTSLTLLKEKFKRITVSINERVDKFNRDRIWIFCHQ